MLILPPTVVTFGLRGSGAPISIHFAKSATTLSGSFSFGGISRPSSCRSALMSRLSSGLPGTTARPLSPPLRMPFARVQPQLALQLLGAGRMALVALGDQDRADVLLEEVDPLRVVRGCRP